jgi:hypothetical protein
MHLCRGEVYFVRVVIAGHGNAAEDLSHLRFVVHEPQKGLTMRASTADPEDVLGSRIKVCNEQVLIQQDDACVQAVENAGGVPAERAVARAPAF